MAETETKPMKALRKCALSFPDVVEGTSCVNRAFRVGKKTFAYLGMKKEGYYLMLKLVDSLEEAERKQNSHPDNYQVGKHGWVTVRLPFEKFAPKGLLEKWLKESYRAFAGGK